MLLLFAFLYAVILKGQRLKATIFEQEKVTLPKATYDLISNNEPVKIPKHSGSADYKFFYLKIQIFFL
jgi:hypothetical protein